MADSKHELDELQQRINQLKSSTGGEESAGSASGGMGKGLQFGVELVAGVAVGGVFGYFVDHWLHTMPLFFIICLLLGFAGGFRNMLREAFRKDTDNETKE